MAGTHRKSTADVKEDLLAQGRRYSFFQALRLLGLISPVDNSVPSSGDDDRLKGVKIRPELSFGFPASDITNIQDLSDNGFLITVSFLGLYGASSPLPAFYTEDLFHEQAEDASAARGFLDIFNQRFFTLLFQCWKKYRLLVQIVEQGNWDDLERLCALSGLGGPDPRPESMDDRYPLLRYSGIFNQHPRSALGLETILTDYLGDLRVEVVSCVERRVKIPHEQKLRLGAQGSALGVDSFLGEELADYQGKFRVHIGPLRRDRFRTLLQSGSEHRKVVRLINLFLTDPLEYDFELTLIEGETKHACLGGAEWSRLGLDTVLFTGDCIGEIKVVFPPEC